jgi:hypothetical protein
MDIKDNNTIYENCVQCDVLTDETIDRDINYRNDYVECAGQLCTNCAIGLDKFILQ